MFNQELACQPDVLALVAEYRSIVFLFFIEDETAFKEYLQCLCLLFEHPANREEIRNKGSLPFLIDMLRDFKTANEFMVSTVNTS